ncbi:MAG: pyridoxal phosphate-dependent aminotransferase [Lachnospiraceae bacterium]
MISEKMKPMVSNNSVVREMFEEGTRLKKQYGAENVFDFSIGNPNVPAPQEVNQAIIDIVSSEPSLNVHGYMNNAGFEDVRQAVADSLNRRFQTKFSAHNLVMTVGAASGLNVVLKTILNPGDEVIVFAPYFLEYKSYVANYDGVLVTVAPDTATFLPDMDVFTDSITQKTKAVIINTPHNPTGVVYSEDIIMAIANVLNHKQQEFGQEIYLISDEPYRELVYDQVQVPFITKYYNNTFIAYSFSKSLSLPGERIGYLVIPDEMTDAETVITAAGIANRILGSVNAPSLIQKVIGRCIDAKVDVAYYDRNRLYLYDMLTTLGFTCIKPQGAFYLFMKSPIENEVEFCAEGKKHNILMVPGSSFACPGYVRIAYCVSYETIERSKAAFTKLAATYFS